MKQELSENIAESIIQANEIEFGLDIAEFTIDQLLDDNILKDIPWVGWIFKAKSTYSSLSDRILLSKIVRFLFTLQKIKADDRSKFVNEIQNDPEKKKKVGSKLLVLIDKIDDFHKADILACVFDHYITGDITYLEFTRLAQAIEQTHIEDIYSLISSKGPNYRNLLNSGLALFVTKINAPTTYGSIEINIPLELSHAGRKLALIMNDELRKENANEKRRIQLFKEYFE